MGTGGVWACWRVKRRTGEGWGVCSAIFWRPKIEGGGSGMEGW